MSGPTRLGRFARVILSATVLGGLIAAGLPVAASAAATHTLTVTVRNAEGALLPNLTLLAIPVVDGHEISGAILEGDGYPTAGAVVNQPGVYKFYSLGDVEHTIYFATATSKTFAQLLGGASNIDRAQTVPANQTTLSVSLAANAVITGTIKNPLGKVLSGATVRSYFFTGGEWVSYSSAKTNASGKYSLVDIDPGSYKLKIMSPKGDFTPFFYGGSTEVETATAINVGVGTSNVINAAFAKYGGAIKGTLRWSYTGRGSYPVDRARVVAIPMTPDGYGTSPDFGLSTSSPTTGSTGGWVVRNLAPGNYILRVDPGYSNQASFYLGERGNTNDLHGVKVFTISAGETLAAGTTKFDADGEGNSLEVQVESWGANPAPITGARVVLQRIANPDEVYEGTTDASGNVVLGMYGKYHTIQRGAFVVIATAPGAWKPAWDDVYLYWGRSGLTLQLQPNNTTTFSPGPTIAQLSTTVGTTYTVSYGPALSNATYTHQWLRNGFPIFGAVNRSYTSQSSDIGTQLSVRVTAREDGYLTEHAFASVTGIVASGAPAPTLLSPPVLFPREQVHVGTVLRASPGVWNTSNLSYSYRWFRDGEEFENPRRSYTVTLADLGSSFTIEVQPAKGGYEDAQPVTSEPVTASWGPSTQPKTAMLITAATKGLAKGSTRFTVTPGEWSGPDSSFTYSWLLGGVEVGVDSSYVAQSRAIDLTKTLEVRVTGTTPGFDEGSTVITARKAKLGLALVVSPVVTVSPSQPVTGVSPIFVGQTLSVSEPGEWTHASDDLGEMTFSYQWLRKVGKYAAKPIAGAKSPNYTAVLADINAKLTVKITAHSSRWSDGSVTVPAGTGANDTRLTHITSTITISGSRAPGTLLTSLVSDEWAAAGAKMSFQWYGCALPKCKASSSIASFSKIAGATKATYTTSASLAKGRVYLVATAARPGFVTARIISTPTTILAKNVIPVLTPPAVRLNGVSSEVVSQATVGTYLATRWPTFGVEPDRASAVLEICTSECLENGAVWTLASGINPFNGSFQLAGSSWGQGDSFLRSKVIVSRAGYLESTLYSVPIPVVQGHIIGSEPAVAQSPEGTWSVNAVSVISPIARSVQWWVGGEIRGTSQSYTIDQADAGKSFFVVVRDEVPGYHDRVFTRTFQAIDPATVPSQPVSITGATVDDTLGLTDPTPWDLPSADTASWKLQYYWSGRSADKPTTTPTYTPVGADVGTAQSVRIVATSPTYGILTRTVTMTEPLLAGPAIVLTDEPVLTWSGDLEPGKQVTITTPAYSDHLAVPRYLWESSADGMTWVRIAGVTGTTFTPSLTDSKRKLRVTVTGARGGHPSSTFVTPIAQILEGNVIRRLTSPALSGDARVGDLLTLDPGTWSSGAALQIEWLLNGNPIPGVAGPTYTPLPTHAGDEISVRVTGRQAGKLDVVADTAAFTIARAAAPTSIKLPVISGSTTLAATPGVWSASGLTFHYQWSVDGVAVEGATADSFVLPTGVTKSRVSVVISTERFGYESAQVTVTG